MRPLFKEVEIEHPYKNSRYKKSRVFTDQTSIFFDLPKNINIPKKQDDLYFKVTIKFKDRLDLVAHRFYKDSKLWWIIAAANNLEDPFELPVDSVLTIPSISSIFGHGGVLG